MCTEQTTPSVARKDITCYKIVNPKNMDGVFRSAFLEFKYSLGVKYVEKEFAGIIHSHTVREGFHSYRTISVAQNRLYFAPYVLIKCVIPKGSRYYESYTGEEYCSDTLIPVAWKPMWHGKWSEEWSGKGSEEM